MIKNIFDYTGTAIACNCSLETLGELTSNSVLHIVGMPSDFISLYEDEIDDLDTCITLDWDGYVDHIEIAVDDKKELIYWTFDLSKSFYGKITLDKYSEEEVVFTLGEHGQVEYPFTLRLFY